MSNEENENKNLVTENYIKEIPDIRDYEEIIKAAKTGRLIIFIGAGVSKLLGLPLWREFAFNRLNTIYNEGLIDYRTFEDLKKLDPKKLLTICKIFMLENNINPRPAREVFKVKYDEKYKQVYSELYSINAIYITTNYDECLDHLTMRIETDGTHTDDLDNIGIDITKESKVGDIIYNKSELLESKLRNGNVIHIHGSVKDESSMVVTLSDYLKSYGNISRESQPELSVFLDRVFNSKYVVLFMGYGLEEYEILEYMLSKSKNPKNTRNHYMLYSCYAEDYKMTNLLKKYYLGFGVELIPYNISKKGHEQLIDIIQEWSKVLSGITNEQDYIQKTEFIDGVIGESGYRFEVDIRAVIEMINDDESLEKYLFSNISEKKWLDPLITSGFFNPEKVPIPIQRDNGYIVPYWPQLDLLRKIVEEIDPNDKDTINKILCIIKAVSLFGELEGKPIDNYRVWGQFVELVFMIPNHYIDMDVIELIKIWRKSDFNSDFVKSDIGKKLIPKFLDSLVEEDNTKAELIIDYLIDFSSDKKTMILGEYYFKEIFN